MIILLYAAHIIVLIGSHANWLKSQDRRRDKNYNTKKSLWAKQVYYRLSSPTQLGIFYLQSFYIH